MRRVLVTGATGFLGGEVCSALRARGDTVIAIGRDAAKLAKLAASGATALALDLARDDPAGLKIEADAMVHAAALSTPWGAPAAFAAANIEGTRAAIALARSAGIRRFVNISTSSVYFRFADQTGLTEDAALPAPVNSYAATKRAAEALVLDAADLDPISLRPRGLYGAGDTALLPRLLKAARAGPLPRLRGGLAATDLTYVVDAADAVLAALDAPSQPAHRLFNISGGQALMIADVAEAAGAAAGVPIRWRDLSVGALLAYARAAEAICACLPGRPEPRITAYGAGLFAYVQTLDISAARAHLGWRPRISFAEGLARTFGA